MCGELSKLGTTYQTVLASILRHLNPGADVAEGEWVEGPDGRRELDVVLRGSIAQKPVSILFECKDYNRQRRIGIEIVDAFDSKLRDLGFDKGIICSNADFSLPARAKATRLSISLIGLFGGSKYRISEYYEGRAIFYSEENSRY